MSATLTPIELLTQEIGILSDKRKSLEAAIKASEARLRDIRSEFDSGSIKVKRDLDALSIATERQRADIVGHIDPLKREIAGLRAQVAAEQARLDAVKAERIAVTDAKFKELDRLDTELKKKQHAIASVSADLQDLKMKVGAL